MHPWTTLRQAKHETRFWQLVDITSDDECWPWKGNKDMNGYGRFRLDGKLYLARRCAYALSKGDVEVDARVISSCKNHACVNPHHLRKWRPVYRFEVIGEAAPLHASSYGHKH
jgi:hypothetical protein